MSIPAPGSSRSVHQDAADQLLPSLRAKLQAPLLDQPIAVTTSSLVYKTFSKLYNRTVAVKVINKKAIEHSIAEKFLPRELDITLKVNHPHLARCLGLFQPNPSKVVLVQEFYERGNLLDYVVREKRIKELPLGCRYFRQIIEGLNYLHERKIVHRDLKLENIVLNSNGDIKLLDFGFARHIERRERTRSFCGTRPYSSPQINRHQPYDSYAADYYSVGMCLYTMLVGKWPQTTNGQGIDFPDGVPSTSCRRLIASLLEDNEQLRAGYKECIWSEWMSNEPHWIFAGNNFVYESIPEPQMTDPPLKMEVE